MVETVVVSSVTAAVLTIITADFVCTTTVAINPQTYVCAVPPVNTIVRLACLAC